MIEVTGLIFGDASLEVRITDLGSDSTDFTSYGVRVAVRDGDGDHLYQRVLHNVLKVNGANILGVLQAALDDLPEEAFRASTIWRPGRHNDLRLELP